MNPLDFFKVKQNTAKWKKILKWKWNTQQAKLENKHNSELFLMLYCSFQYLCFLLSLNIFFFQSYALLLTFSFFQKYNIQSFCESLILREKDHWKKGFLTMEAWMIFANHRTSRIGHDSLYQLNRSDWF